MKIVFLASGNKAVGTVSAFVRSQFESLQQEGQDMSLFPIVGRGWKAYAAAVFRLRRLVKDVRPDIVHAHYSVCGVVAALATMGTRTKVVVSILGSFPSKTFKLRWVRFFIKHVWDVTLTKSARTANQLGIELPVVPNGVNLDQFNLIDYSEARRTVGFEDGKKYVIWCSNPSRSEKRFPLAESVVAGIKDANVVLYPVYDKSHDEVVKYMCAADVLLLTSSCEGSPNVIKEAMACNCPIVSTDVGDVRWVTQNVDGTYVSDGDAPEALSECLKKALAYNKRTVGRSRIVSEGLTAPAVAKRIISIYDAI